MEHFRLQSFRNLSPKSDKKGNQEIWLKSCLSGAPGFRSRYLIHAKDARFHCASAPHQMLMRYCGIIGKFFWI